MNRIPVLLAALTTMIGCSGGSPDMAASSGGTDGIDRTVLPIAEPSYPAETQLDARNATAPPRFEVKAPPARPTS